MKKREIVKNSWEFEDIINNGECIKNKYYVIHYKKNNLSYDRYGISVSKKLGNAVFRNKYKRKLRAIIDNYKKSYVNSEDYIIILRKEAIQKTHAFLQKEFFNLMLTRRKDLKNEKK